MGILLLARLANVSDLFLRRNFKLGEECRLRNRTSPRMLPRPWTTLTTTLAGRGLAPPAKSQKPKGVQSLARDPGNDQNRRNALRRNAENDVRLAHAAVARAVQARAVPRAVRERAVPEAGEEKAAPRAAERADLRPESRPTVSALIKSSLTKSRATSVICARSETRRISTMK